MKTIFVYGGDDWKNCVEMARDIARILHTNRVRHVTLYGTNAEVLTDHCRILVRTLNEKFYMGRVCDECFYYPTAFAQKLVKERAFISHSCELIDYILKEEMSHENYRYRVGKF